MKLKSPRMSACALLSAALFALVWVTAPEKAFTVIYKLSLVTLASVSAYWLDRWAFPYARPDRFLTGSGDAMANHKQVFVGAMLRRAIIMAGAMLAVGLGL